MRSLRILNMCSVSFDILFLIFRIIFFINSKVSTWVNGEKVTKYSDHLYLHFKGQLSKIEEVDLRSNPVEGSKSTVDDSNMMTPTVLMVVIAAGIVLVGAATAAAVITWIRKR